MKFDRTLHIIHDIALYVKNTSVFGRKYHFDLRRGKSITLSSSTATTTPPPRPPSMSRDRPAPVSPGAAAASARAVAGALFGMTLPRRTRCGARGAAFVSAVAALAVRSVCDHFFFLK